MAYTTNKSKSNIYERWNFKRNIFFNIADLPKAAQEDKVKEINFFKE